MGNNRFQPTPQSPQPAVGVAEPDRKLTEVGMQEGRVGRGAAPPDPRMTGPSELDGDSARLRGLASAEIDNRYVELGRALSPLGLRLGKGLERQLDGSYRVDFRGRPSQLDVGDHGRDRVGHLGRQVHLQKGLAPLQTEGHMSYSDSQ